MNFKQIHLGEIIEKRVQELNKDVFRICHYLKCTDKELEETFKSENLSTEVLLKWSKLLEYDFFRIYSQHLILYSPPSTEDKVISTVNTQVPQFRKNLYTNEIIQYIVQLVLSGDMTKLEIIERYKIPKSTLYRWIRKYEQAK